jgi:hypothetical protein
MHDEGCGCELCREYSVHEQEVALQKLEQAVNLLQGADSEASAIERRELDSSEVVLVDAGLENPLPAVMFHPPSRLHRLKAGFTYSYLLDSGIEEIAESLRSKIREHLSE